MPAGFTAAASTDDQMSLDRELMTVLSRHLSPVIARSVLARALGGSNLGSQPLTAENLGMILPRLERAIRLFLEPQAQALLRSELDGLSNQQREASRLESVDIDSEPDVARARLVAREMCASVGTRSLIAQRVVTIVSELARNICSYTSGGSVSLFMSASEVARIMRVVASDQGPGIPHLSEVLSGNYQSKTGLGKGLSGVKRLADRFDIQTSNAGTRVEAEVRL